MKVSQVPLIKCIAMSAGSIIIVHSGSDHKLSVQTDRFIFVYTMIARSIASMLTGV